VIDENKPGILSHIHHSQSTESYEEVNREDNSEYEENDFMSEREDNLANKS